LLMATVTTQDKPRRREPIASYAPGPKRRTSADSLGMMSPYGSQVSPDSFRTARFDSFLNSSPWNILGDSDPSFSAPSRSLAMTLSSQASAWQPMDSQCGGSAAQWASRSPSWHHHHPAFQGMRSMTHMRSMSSMTDQELEMQMPLSESDPMACYKNCDAFDTEGASLDPALMGEARLPRDAAHSSRRPRWASMSEEELREMGRRPGVQASPLLQTGVPATPSPSMQPLPDGWTTPNVWGPPGGTSPRPYRRRWASTTEEEESPLTLSSMRGSLSGRRRSSRPNDGWQHAGVSSSLVAAAASAGQTTHPGEGVWGRFNMPPLGGMPMWPIPGMPGVPGIPVPMPYGGVQSWAQAIGGPVTGPDTFAAEMNGWGSASSAMPPFPGAAYPSMHDGSVLPTGADLPSSASLAEDRAVGAAPSRSPLVWISERKTGKAELEREGFSVKWFRSVDKCRRALSNKGGHVACQPNTVLVVSYGEAEALLGLFQQRASVKGLRFVVDARGCTDGAETLWWSLAAIRPEDSTLVVATSWHELLDAVRGQSEAMAILHGHVHPAGDARASTSSGVQAAFAESTAKDIQAAVDPASRPSASDKAAWTLIWVSEQAFKPGFAPHKSQLEALGCQVKGYKTHKNAARALEKKRVLVRTVILVSSSEAPPLLTYLATRSHLAETRVVVEGSHSRVSVPEGAKYTAAETWEEAVAAIREIADDPGFA